MHKQLGLEIMYSIRMYMPANINVTICYESKYPDVHPTNYCDY